MVRNHIDRGIQTMCSGIREPPSAKMGKSDKIGVESVRTKVEIDRNHIY